MKSVVRVTCGGGYGGKTDKTPETCAASSASGMKRKSQAFEWNGRFRSRGVNLPLLYIKENGATVNTKYTHTFLFYTYLYSTVDFFSDLGYVNYLLN